MAQLKRDAYAAEQARLWDREKQRGSDAYSRGL